MLGIIYPYQPLHAIKLFISLVISFLIISPTIRPKTKLDNLILPAYENSLISVLNTLCRIKLLWKGKTPWICLIFLTLLIHSAIRNLFLEMGPIHLTEITWCRKVSLSFYSPVGLIRNHIFTETLLMKKGIAPGQGIWCLVMWCILYLDACDSKDIEVDWWTNAFTFWTFVYLYYE